MISQGGMASGSGGGGGVRASCWLQESDRLRVLPPELVTKIVGDFSARDLAHFLAVCQAWRQREDDCGAWRHLFKRDFPLAHRALVGLNQQHECDVMDEKEASFVAWGRAYCAWALGQEPWHQEHCLKGHTDSVSCMTMLPDGRLATGSRDATVRIWSSEGKELHVLQGHTGPINCIITLADGCLATGYNNATVRIWSSEGKELHVLQGHTDAITCMTTLPDGRLATGSWDKTVRIWSSEGKELHVLQGQTDAIYCMTTLADGCLATGCADGMVRIWSLVVGKQLHVLQGHTAWISCMTTLADGRLATGSGDGTVRIWSAEGKELQVLQGHTNAIWCMKTLADGRLATGFNDQTVRIWSWDCSTFMQSLVEPNNFKASAQQLEQIEGNTGADKHILRVDPIVKED